MIPSNHSPEAIAAYPDIEPSDTFPTGMSRASERTAFDAGVAATHARQYAATREALVRAFFAAEFPKATYETGQIGDADEWMYQNARARADALLATPGPLLDAAEAWSDGLMAGQDRWMDAREFGDKPVNPYRSETP